MVFLFEWEKATHPTLATHQSAHSCTVPWFSSAVVLMPSSTFIFSEAASIAKHFGVAAVGVVGVTLGLAVAVAAALLHTLYASLNGIIFETA